MVAIGGFRGLPPPRRTVRLVVGVAVVAVEIVLVAPHVSRGGAALADLRWRFVVAAVACEIASVATYARLRRTLLAAGGFRVSTRRMGALAVASNAISATVPAGAAVSAGYLYRELRRNGASAPLVGWVLAAAAVVSGLAFSVITMAGTVLDGDDSLTGVVGPGGLSLVAVVALIGGLMVITRHPRPIVHALRSVCGRLRRRRPAPDCGGAGPVGRGGAQALGLTPRGPGRGAALRVAPVERGRGPPR